MIRNMGKSKAHALYDRATHCRKRSGSSSTSYRRSAFVDHQGIEHHPEHFFFRTATPPQFCRWREEGSDSDSDSDSDLDTAPSPAFLRHHHHQHRSPRYRQRAGSVASSSLSATLPPTSFFLPSLEVPSPTPNLTRVQEPVKTLWINQPSISTALGTERGRVKPINGFRRGFESLKLEFRIGLLRTRKRMAKVWNRL